MRFFDLAPVFVDVDPRTMNLSVEDCKKRLTSKTKAVMPVHWYGLPCEMDEICAFAEEHGLVVVEDASHAHGAGQRHADGGIGAAWRVSACRCRSRCRRSRANCQLQGTGGLRTGDRVRQLRFAADVPWKTARTASTRARRSGRSCGCIRFRPSSPASSSRGSMSGTRPGMPRSVA